MAQLLDPFEARLVAILESGRGVDGSLGADAQSHAFPANRLHRHTHNAPLRDASDNLTGFDRAYGLRWQDAEDLPDPQNPLDATQLLDLRCVFDVGFVYGRGAPESLITQATGTESKPAATQYPERRALSEMETIRRAVTFPGLFSDANAESLGNGRAFVDVVREPGTRTTLTDLGGGKLVAAMTLLVRIQYDSATRYDP